jgi:hypothetical protein
MPSLFWDGNHAVASPPLLALTLTGDFHPFKARSRRTVAQVRQYFFGSRLQSLWLAEATGIDRQQKPGALR